MVGMAPERVTGPEQGKSNGKFATFSCWTGILGMAFPPDERNYTTDSVVIATFVGTVCHEKVRLTFG